MDYKKYSLENLENWMHDAMSAGEATPQEIYDVIVGVVKENYYTYKNQTSKAYELLALLNGNGKGHIKAYDDCVDKVLSCDKDDPSPECKGAWNDFWENNTMPPWGHSDMEALHYTEEELNAMCDAAENKIKMGVQNSGENGDGYFIPTDKVVKWQLPIELDGPSGEYYVIFPDDLLEAANLKEGDQVNWIDRGDGSFELRKVNGTK
jgi:hypothetical protein